MTKTFHIGDLVRYDDDFVKGRLQYGDMFGREPLTPETNSVGTVVGFSRDSSNRTRIKVDWFNWFGMGPEQTVEYFSEIQLISGGR